MRARETHTCELGEEHISSHDFTFWSDRERVKTLLVAKHTHTHKHKHALAHFGGRQQNISSLLMKHKCFRCGGQ